MNIDGEIVTVRPSVPVDTLQKLPNYVGISNQTAGSTGISMNVVIIPAGAKAQPHYHDGFETAIYILKGDVQTFYGEGLAKSCVNKQGDFLFIPAGVPHQPMNLSSETDAIALVARNDANEQESVRPYDLAGDQPRMRTETGL
ncbi:MAG: cupin domain-containing protein [Thiotrichales bacterium]